MARQAEPQAYDRDSMPTLIRLLIVLIVLGGLGLAGMVALTVMVDPGEKDITIKIPARDLVAPSSALDLNNLPAPVNVAPKDAAPASGASSAVPQISAVTSAASDLASIDTSDSGASESGVKTVDNAGGDE
jgi:hypothetical protein